MSDAKENNDSFLRKVVRFVANPATDWADLNSRQEDVRETEYAKSELKAMIERKRRNDFVRKREFDMLRKVRREGLSSEQLAALGGSSRLDDSEGRLQESVARADSDVKAKINEIEQQMVGENFGPSTRRPPLFYEAPTAPGALASAPAPFSSRTEPPASRLSGRTSGRMPLNPPIDVPLAARPEPARPAPAPAPSVAPAVMNAGLPPLSAMSLNAGSGNDFANPFAIEVSEMAHDPELDEAVIAFANADFEACEQALASMTAPGGSRAQHAETWLVRFDLYRAIGEQHKFESLAIDYAQQFGWSAPQWFSLPRLVAEAASDDKPTRSRIDGQVGWVCPEVVDADVVAKLRSQTLQMPLPWVLDWTALRSIDAEGCARLSELFAHWANEPLDMRWLSGDHLLTVLADASPTGVKDVDPAYWLLRLNALRLAHRADQFDEAAIDYCVTYEVSPPAWERAACKARISGPNVSTTSPPLSLVSDASTTFLESSILDETGTVQSSSVELSGQLVGDITETLRKMDAELGTAAIVDVSCAKLIRVDFIAAGDLLNWVLQRRSENRMVSFSQAHRLVALFFGAMGINEHAKVKVRTV
jgi:hypothetical protein